MGVPGQKGNTKWNAADETRVGIVCSHWVLHINYIATIAFNPDIINVRSAAKIFNKLNSHLTIDGCRKVYSFFVRAVNSSLQCRDHLVAQNSITTSRHQMASRDYSDKQFQG